MDPRKFFPLKSGYVTREVGNELVLVPLTGDISQMNELFTMNATGRIIWENISENCTMNSLIHKITENFDVTEAKAEEDIEAFLTKMLKLMA
jgi:hypothetical protein